ncbi:MAG: hypothetical protein M1374_02120 [Firmicutes bacterium]|jgi:hypothetical protein|nr:hypothetical protein [Bacillota bacterium]
MESSFTFDLYWKLDGRCYGSVIEDLKVRLVPRSADIGLLVQYGYKKDCSLDIFGSQDISVHNLDIDK